MVFTDDGTSVNIGFKDKVYSRELHHRQHTDMAIQNLCGLGEDGCFPAVYKSKRVVVEEHQGFNRHYADIIVRVIHNCWINKAISPRQEMSIKSMVYKVLDYLDYIPFVLCRYGDFRFIIDDHYVACLNDGKICDYRRFITLNFNRADIVEKYDGLVGLPVNTTMDPDDCDYVWVDVGTSDHIGVLYHFTGNYRSLDINWKAMSVSDVSTDFYMLCYWNKMVISKTKKFLSTIFKDFHYMKSSDKVVCRITKAGETYKDNAIDVIKEFHMDVSQSVASYPNHIVALLDLFQSYNPKVEQMEEQQGWKVFCISDNSQIFTKNFVE